jgi:hypothetical protein
MIGAIVRETILMQRVKNCQHEWKKLNETEDQCCNCTVIATENGKKNLENIKNNKLFI